MKKVCGLDVHKDSIFCAIYNGEEYSEAGQTHPNELRCVCPDNIPLSL